eukprot:TRINITY_DN24068_c0_g1_i1.p1 TRINITY_DN24068_c0_g1~~TRINITY_DN24068_c0_g1_i1.p1  ORF type:complete len:217 (+),score=55.73 TRINITY_DN24068_c0_g1_i1:54-653(+)
MTTLPSVTFVTGNANKLKEVNAILKGNVEVTSRKVDLPELQGESFDIAKEKAREACRQLKEPVLTEDTGLCFNGLNGLPGPYIKWFLEKLTVEGLPKMLAGFEDKTGYAQCIFTYCEPGQEPVCFEGRCEGSIVAPRGPRNFGWDPCFLPSCSKLTFAEMDPAEKNKISHRALALEKVKAHFKELHESCEKKNKIAKKN